MRIACGVAGPIALLLVGACGGSGTSPEPTGVSVLEPGDHAVVLSFGGESRRVLIRVPPGDVPSRGHPVLVAFHGGGGTPEGFKGTSGLDAVGDVEGFVVVHPGGTGNTANALTWNGGPDCCGYARDRDVDDVGFALALLDDLATRHPIDRGRVSLTGHSNGAMMAYRLAAEEPRRWEAVIGVGAAMQSPAVTPSGAVPLLHIHSVDDPRAFYEGGTRDDRTFTPVEDMLTEWRTANACAATPDTVARRTGTGPDAEHTAVLLRWSCADAPLEHWKLTGAGHAWPGARVPALRELIVGPSTTVVTAWDEIFTFIRAVSGG